jgi:hypothetical protein
VTWCRNNKSDTYAELQRWTTTVFLMIVSYACVAGAMAFPPGMMPRGPMMPLPPGAFLPPGAIPMMRPPGPGE